MKTITTGNARTRLPQLMSEMAASHEPIQITGKKANAVLIAEDDLRAIQETLYLLSVPGMRSSIREGLNTALAECATEIEW